VNSEEPEIVGSTSTEVTLHNFALGNLTVMLVLIGATASLYGPLLLVIAKNFHLSLPTAGIVLSVHFVGALIGVPIGWIAGRRFRGTLVVGGTLFILALGASVITFASTWDFFLCGVLLVGIGFGGLDFSLNTMLARTALKGRAHRLSVANAGYGFGAVIGPLLIILVNSHNFPVLFAGVALLALVLSTLNRGLVAPPLDARVRARERLARDAQRRQILMTFIVAYVLYVATETSTSGWIASQLHGEGFSASIASLATGGFWMGLALGRTAGGQLHKRVSERALVLGGLMICSILSLVAYSHELSPYVYPLIGLALSSVYPMGLIWYTKLCPNDSDGLALIMFFMMAGGIIGPAFESLMVAAIGIHVVSVVIGVIAVLDVVAFSFALRYREQDEGRLGEVPA
jgi:fucose permease